MATKKKKATAPVRKSKSKPRARKSPFTPGWTPEERAIALTRTAVPETLATRRSRILPFIFTGGALAIIVIAWSLLHHKQGMEVQNPAPPSIQASVQVPSPQPVAMPKMSAPHEAQPKAQASFRIWIRAKQPSIRINALRGEDEAAEVRIFTHNNKLIRLLQSEKGKRGYVLLDWDGLDKQGRKVPAGSYFISVSSAGGDRIQELEIR